MSRPPPPAAPPRPVKPAAPTFDPMARALAQSIRDGHGVNQAATLDMSEEIGSPRGYVGTHNIALERALGCPGIPLGRITEISGWNSAGKSTMLDQILAQCQAEGGLGILADTERNRNRAYMATLGVDPRSLVWIGGKTIESMFAEVETSIRNYAHYNAIAWYHALCRADVKCPPPDTKPYAVWDPDKKGVKGAKPERTFQFAVWGRQQAAALLEFQRKAGIQQNSMRDDASRQVLRPCVLFGTEEEQKEGERAWVRGDATPYAQPADRPVVVGWDSVAGTPSEREMDGDAYDEHMAEAAKAIKRNLRRVVQMVDDEAIAIVLVNQRYEKIARPGQRLFGPTSETYGGGGIKYHAAIRIEVDKIGEIFARGADDKDPPIGQIVRIQVPKNKVESPFVEAKFGLVYGRGAENAWTIHEDLKERGIISVKGGWSKFTDPTILGTADKAFGGWQELSNMMAGNADLWERCKGIYMEGRIR